MEFRRPTSVDRVLYQSLLDDGELRMSRSVLYKLPDFCWCAVVWCDCVLLTCSCFPGCHPVSICIPCFSRALISVHLPLLQIKETMSSLPDTHRALVLSSFASPLSKSRSTPTPDPPPRQRNHPNTQHTHPRLRGEALLRRPQVPAPPAPDHRRRRHRPHRRRRQRRHDVCGPANSSLWTPWFADAIDPAQTILLGVHGGISEGAGRLMKQEDCVA